MIAERFAEGWWSGCGGAQAASPTALRINDCDLSILRVVCPEAQIPARPRVHPSSSSGHAAVRAACARVEATPVRGNFFLKRQGPEVREVERGQGEVGMGLLKG